MTEHVFDELPQLLSGDADRATVATVAAHVRECADCREELISAVVAHAALMSSVRFAPELPATDQIVERPASPAALPDLSPVFAQIRREIAEGAAAGDARTTHRRRRPAVRYGLVAAVVALGLIAGGGVYAAERGLTSSTSSRAVALSAYGIGTSPASAKLVGGDKMVVDASSLPSLASGHYYEVWLTNGQRTAMAPVGQLDAAKKGTFTVTSAEMSGYAAIEVSVQMTGGVGSYSGVSVLRGSYA
jgi:Anti-sigma-K factor rskA